VITGLLTRSDRDRALRMPIIHIPGGTGNSLAASIAFKCGEPFSARGGFCQELTLMGIKPSYKQLRLHHFESSSDGHKCVFLSVVWGLIADIDIGSERFRWAGMIRLHMEALLRTMQLPTVAKYKGRISYLPIDDESLISKTRFKNNEPRKSFGNGHFGGGDIPDLADMDLNISKPKTNTVKDSFKNRELVKIPRLDEPVPDDWITLESEFVMVNVTSLSHIGSDLPYIPSSKLEEEVLYLSLVDWSVVKNRFSIARMFADMDICSHLDYPCFHFIPVKACRIEPAPGAGGHVAVDGEPCTSGSAFQVVASSYCATVACRELRD
jgi:sphingosine kinase